MKNDWIKTSELVEKLGISKDTLYRWISLKKLKTGVHYRDVSLGGARKTYQWHLKRIEALIGEK